MCARKKREPEKVPIKIQYPISPTLFRFSTIYVISNMVVRPCHRCRAETGCRDKVQRPGEETRGRLLAASRSSSFVNLCPDTSDFYYSNSLIDLDRMRVSINRIERSIDSPLVSKYTLNLQKVSNNGTKHSSSSQYIADDLS